MNSNYKAHVNTNFEFTVSKEEAASLDMVVGKEKAQVIYDHESIDVDLLKSDFNNRTYQFKIKGTVYEVRIDNELDLLIAEMGLATGEDAVSNEIYAPMPGLLIDVSVTEGQEVKEGEVLCVLEAMKMENALLSPKNGVIKTVHIATGQTVEKGALLIDFEEV